MLSNPSEKEGKRTAQQLNWHPVKKADNPLSKTLKTPEGTEVFHVVKAFALPANVWRPERITEEKDITEPLLAHYANIFYTLGAIKLRECGGRGYYHPTHTLHSQHFAERLSRPQAERLLERVIKNAKQYNETGLAGIQIDEVGVFGSYLSDKPTLGDLDIVYRASFKKSKKPLPESSYFYRRTNEPTCLARHALQHRIKRWEVSAHYIIEVEKIGAPYQILWTRKAGHCRKEIVVPENKPMGQDTQELDRINRECNEVIEKLKTEHFPPPTKIVLPKRTKPMSQRAWEECLEGDSLIPTLAHVRCLPEGPLKKEWETILEKQKFSEAFTIAKKRADSFLARSVLLQQIP